LGGAAQFGTTEPAAIPVLPSAAAHRRKIAKLIRSA
jgi:hypothetical protein